MTERDDRGFITLIEGMILLLVLGLLGFWLMRPTLHPPTTGQLKRHCISNMKTIEGATELYLMDKFAGAKKPIVDGTHIDLATLRAEGHMKQEPVCFKNGKYTIVVHVPQGESTRTLEIRCSIHNTIDDATAGL